MLVTKLPFNISPKIAYTVVMAIVTWALTHYAIQLDPEISGAISLAVGSLFGYHADTGEIVTTVGPANDSLISQQTIEDAQASQEHKVAVPPPDKAGPPEPPAPPADRPVS